MGGFLSAVGKKLAERWVSLLVLPGAAYVAVVVVARILGHAHAWSMSALIEQITRWVRAPIATTVGGQVVLLAALLAGAAVAGLAAQGLGSLIEQLALAADWRSWPRPVRWLARRRVDRRRAKWAAASAAYMLLLEAAGKARARGNQPDSVPRHAAYRAMRRVADEEPDRPSWSGDRIHAVAVRLDRDHHVDLPTVWPHLWLHLPDAVRVEITTARDALTRAATLGGWAALYALLTVWWWPAVLLAAVLAATCWRRIRITTDMYALLLEASARLHLVHLARHLGIDHAGPLNPEVGEVLTDLLHSRPPSRPVR